MLNGLNEIINMMVVKDEGWKLKNMLKKEGMKSDLFSDSNETPILILAAQHNSINCVETLLELELECDIEQTDDNGQNIFHIACANGNSNLLQIFLLDENIKNNQVLSKVINAQDKKSLTPLMLAIINGHPHTVNQLFELAKDKVLINKFDNNGNTALHHATSHENAYIIKTLIENEAKFNLVNKELMTSTDLANPMIKSIIEDGLIKKNYPLHYAAKTGDIFKLKMALESNEKLDAFDKKGNTPLHYAAMCGESGAAFFLIEVAKVPVDIKNNQLFTPYDLAYGHQQHAITNYLNKNYFRGKLQTVVTTLATNQISQAVIGGLVSGATTHLFKNYVTSHRAQDGDNNSITQPLSGTEVGYQVGTELSEAAISSISKNKTWCSIQ